MDALRITEQTVAGDPPPLRLYPHENQAVASAATKLAASLAAAHPDLRMEVLEPDRSAVDAGRAELLRLCLDDRVQIHHRDAFLRTAIRAAFSDSQSILLQFK
jgi:hypothetical protein